jgi:hypothetical protein
VTTEAEPTPEERAAIHDVIGLIERKFAWDRLDPELQRLFASRLADMLPGFDPASRWEAMLVAHRREWIWHERQTDEQFRAVWETEAEQLRSAADDATVEAFRSLAGTETR